MAVLNAMDSSKTGPFPPIDLTWNISTAMNRAVGAGLAGPAAAGPIFGQLTHAKMLYEL